MLRSTLPLLFSLLALSAAQATAQNPLFRANRTFFTALWTANPIEYTTAGQTVPAGAMHWRAFTELGDQRLEPRQITGLGTWWQPSDPNGVFPQTINSLEFRFYPTTADAAGLVIPDTTQQPLLTIPPMPLLNQTGGSFKSLTIALGNPMPITTQGDYALCGVYPGGTNASQVGEFGLLPSASNIGAPLPQSYYGFVYPGGPITHFPLGGARSSFWVTEAAPTLSLRSNWAISDAHNMSGYLNGAFGDVTSLSPLADPNWPGWSDSRSLATIGLTVFSNGRDGDLVVPMFTAGARNRFGLPILGLIFELDVGDPLLGAFAGLAGPIQNGRYDVDIPLISAPDPTLLGSHLGFEAILASPLGTFAGTTGAAFTRN